MGVIYKLKDEVVQFIISQRQSNPLSSCRQLAESVSQKFGLNLSKSSVHDVLKESGIITPRGRKPKDKFAIPQEKKKQIQTSLAQVNLLLPPPVGRTEVKLIADVVEIKNSPQDPSLQSPALVQDEDMEISPEHEGAGKVFLKAVLWDLGIFSENMDPPKLHGIDWSYFLTYSKAVKIDMENDKTLIIDFPVPIERCIREVADGLVNNVRPFIIHKIPDENLFKACMEAQAGSTINKISIVDQKDHIILIFDNIMEINRSFIINNRLFVESNEISFEKRVNSLFFPQMSDNNSFIDKIMNLNGFETIKKGEIIITLVIDDAYANKAILQEAIEKLNGMYLRDERDRLVSVKIQG